MTALEKLKIEHPEQLELGMLGGARGCPDDYKYLPPMRDCKGRFGKFSPKQCTECWSREIPEIPEKIVDALCEVGTPNPVSPEEVKAAMTIKDSGTRREFETGAVRDIQEGKGRMDLLPWAAIMEVSKHCENGAKKYGEHNVDKGIPTHSLCDSAARHLAKYLDGWTDEPHLLAATWNLLWAVQMEIKHKEMVDTPWKKEEPTIDTLPE